MHTSHRGWGVHVKHTSSVISAVTGLLQMSKSISLTVMPPLCLLLRLRLRTPVSPWTEIIDPFEPSGYGETFPSNVCFSFLS